MSLVVGIVWLFFRISVIYVIVSLTVVGAIRDIALDLVVEAGVATIAFSVRYFASLVWLLPAFLLLLLLAGRDVRQRADSIAYALLGSIFLQIGFCFLKSTIPLVVPFFADPSLSTFDQWIHFGRDPWELLHGWTQGLRLDYLFPVYVSLWSIPAIALPFIMAVFDRNLERKARFVVLYLVSWIFLGNILALAGSSAGPVYYDALLGTDRFAGLLAALDASGVTESQIGFAQAELWYQYSDRHMALGLGISAFPSVHVAIATVVMLYMAERSRWLLAPGLVFLGLILFLSVYTGYHYAVDGYASVLVILVCWLVLRRLPMATLFARARYPSAASA